MVDEAQGLTSAEVAARLAAHGPNRLVGRDRAARFKAALEPLLDPMAIMLVAASAVYLALGERREALVMLVALAPVVGVDAFLDARSRSALAQLARTVAPRARVRRDGRETTVDTADLVPGDVLLLKEGEVVHADGVVRFAANLALDESSLTGESEPRVKRPVSGGDEARRGRSSLARPSASPGSPSVSARAGWLREVRNPSEGSEDDDACFYAGSTVVAGHGWGEIAATGRATRFGEIAELVAAGDTSATPLQRRVGVFVGRLAIVATTIALAVVALGRYRGLRWGEALLGGISLAMSAIPEEFPLVFTLFLSVGAWRLTKKGVLVRRLASVETLGSTTVICTDKTGTLTKGEFVLDRAVPAAGVGERELLEAAVLACELPALDAMEQAIRAHAAGRGVDLGALASGWQLVRDHDFDPAGKHMSHVWSAAPSSAGDAAAATTMRVVAKGALEGILEHARVTAAERAAIESAHEDLASAGMRVLAVAGREGASAAATSRADDERDLRFLGLLGFRDPVRREVPDAVRECQAAGVRIKLVTGDHALTAHAVADSAGIAHRHDAIVTGDALAALGDEARHRRIAEASILARISPAQKHEIVEALRRQGEIVAMTGDGINDAPALRRADIGVSMGRRGTDVARAAAALVLVDDDFAAIVHAIREGRKIFLDIQRAFLYLLAFHVPIVGLALLAPLFGLPLLLLPVHLVWLELIVHPVSALLFQGDPPPDDLMRRPPRDPRAPMLPRRSVTRSVVSGGVLTALAFSIYVWRQPDGAPHARAVALATLILGYQLLVIAERAEGAPGAALWPRSLRFWLIWSATGLSLPVLLYVPAAAALADVAPLRTVDWLVALAGATLSLGWRLVARSRAPAG